jgi:hypothetical protein
VCHGYTLLVPMLMVITLLWQLNKTNFDVVIHEIIFLLLKYLIKAFSLCKVFWEFRCSIFKDPLYDWLYNRCSSKPYLVAHMFFKMLIDSFFCCGLVTKIGFFFFLLQWKLFFLYITRFTCDFNSPLVVNNS